MQPFDYLNTTTGLIWTVICIPSGFLLTALGYLLLNRIPATWLCDYNETPSEELLSGKRFRYLRGWGIPISIVMSVCLVLCRLQFNKGYTIYFILLSLIIFTGILIAISDFKYQIIPDQFTIAIGILALAVSVYDLVRGFHILHSAWWSPLAGAGIGAAVMILIDLIGMLVYHREGMGFGDVKLFFAVGILTGFPGTIYAFIISILTATVCFVLVIAVSKILHRNDEAQTDEAVPASETPEDEPAPEQQTQPEDKKDDEAAEDTEQASEEPDEKGVGFTSYLAFGPYIAIAICAYCALFDAIQYLAGLYLHLFN